jgi:hypothetical protein
MSSSSTCCYICLGSDSKKPFIENRGCLCKGSVSIHERCFKKWVASTDSPFSCSVCKADYGGSFLSKFISLEKIMFSGAEDDEDYEEEYFEERVIHGVPVLVDEDEYIYFEDPLYESIFMHSNKMEIKSIRQSCHQQSKKPFHNNRGRQFNRASFSRKR